MSLFFDYFRKTLRFPLIWKEGYLSALVQGAAKAMDQAREDVLYRRTQGLPESCDTEHLDRIGTGRGVRQWPNEPDAFYRERVRAAFAFFQMGGKRSGLEEILRRAGADVEIWEPRDVKAVLSAASTPVLDGSWSMDGTTSLQTAPALVGLPYLAWAEFAVRINLASLRDEWLHDFLKRLVYEYKPARSLPKFVYFMSLATGITVAAKSQSIFVKDTVCKPLRCRPQVDGSWKMGRDAERLKLDASWHLDGFFKLGQVLMPAMAEKKIGNCRISCGGAGGSHVVIYAGYPGADPKVPYFSISKKQRRIDGSWVTGSERKVDGSWRLNQGSLAMPKLGKYPAFQLKSTQKLGFRDPISESWPSIGGGIYGSSNVN